MERFEMIMYMDFHFFDKEQSSSAETALKEMMIENNGFVLKTVNVLRDVDDLTTFMLHISARPNGWLQAAMNRGQEISTEINNMESACAMWIYMRLNEMPGLAPSSYSYNTSTNIDETVARFEGKAMESEIANGGGKKTRTRI